MDFVSVAKGVARKVEDQITIVSEFSGVFRDEISGLPLGGR